MSDLMVFDNVKMTSIEIAELVESRHASIKRSINRLIIKGVIQPAPMVHTNIINDLGVVTGVRDYYVFEGEQGKRDSIIVVAQNCPEFTARLVDRWQELENQVRNQQRLSYGGAINNTLAFAETASRMLNLSNSSKLGMLQKIEKEYNIPPILPQYAIDAPIDAVDGSSRVTKSLTALLEEHNVGMTAREVNPILERHGIIERKSRRGSRGQVKYFWALTPYGLRFGKNVTAPNNQLETQPHYFESRFKELISIIFSD